MTTQPAWRVVAARERRDRQRFEREQRAAENRAAAARIAARRTVRDEDLEIPPYTDDGYAEQQRRRAERFARGLLRIAECRPDWFDHAACRGQTVLFYGPAYERAPAAAERERAARAICAQCPVAEPCRAQGRAGREFGIWGGEDEIERARAGRGSTLSTRRAAIAAAREARR